MISKRFPATDIAGFDSNGNYTGACFIIICYAAHLCLMHFLYLFSNRKTLHVMTPVVSMVSGLKGFYVCVVA